MDGLVTSSYFATGKSQPPTETVIPANTIRIGQREPGQGNHLFDNATRTLEAPVEKAGIARQYKGAAGTAVDNSRGCNEF